MVMTHTRMTSRAPWAPALIALLALVPGTLPFNSERQKATISDTGRFNTGRSERPVTGTADDFRIRDRFTATNVPSGDDSGPSLPDTPRRGAGSSKFQSTPSPDRLHHEDAASLSEPESSIGSKFQSTSSPDRLHHEDAASLSEPESSIGSKFQSTSSPDRLHHEDAASFSEPESSIGSKFQSTPSPDRLHHEDAASFPEPESSGSKFQSTPSPDRLHHEDAASLSEPESSGSTTTIRAGYSIGVTPAPERAEQQDGLKKGARVWPEKGQRPKEVPDTDPPFFSHAAKAMFGQRFKVRVNAAQPSGARAKPPRDQDTGGDEIDDWLKSRSRAQHVAKILDIFGKNLDPQQARPVNATSSPSAAEPSSSPSRGDDDDAENLTSCIHVDGYDDHRWIRAVNFCPRGWTDATVRFLCKEALARDYVMTDTPVQDGRGVVYANRFCARCHRVRKPRGWKIAWTCDSEDPASTFFQPRPSGDVLGMVTSLRRGHFCKLTRSPAVPGGVRPCPAVAARDQHSMPLVNGGNHLPPGSGYPVSLNILMNFDFAGKTHIMFEDYYFEESNDFDSTRCPRVNYVWDGEMGRCREVVCAEGFHFDETYTTCIEDEEMQDEVITDLSQLAQSNDIERVTLTVEVPPAYVPLFQLTEYHDLWMEQIASQLNITVNRIKMFNITVDVGTGEGSTLVIEKLGNGLDRSVPLSEAEAAADLRSSSPADHGVVGGGGAGGGLSEGQGQGQGQGHAAAVAGGDAGNDQRLAAANRVLKPTSSDEGGSSTDTTIRLPAASRTSSLQAGPPLGEGGGNKKTRVDLLNHGQSKDRKSSSSSSSSSSKERLLPLPETTLSQPYDTPLNLPAKLTTTLAPEKKGKIIMSFILLPPQSLQTGQRSGPLVKELNSLVSKGELKFTINGTSLTVDNVAKEDTVGVFSPACPNGRLLVLDGQQVQMLYGENNMTMLQDLRTGKCYVKGMFDVSFLVTQPIGNTTQQPQSYVYNALACEMPHIANSRCTRIRIKKDEYTIDSNSKVLTFQNGTYDITSYEYMDDRYQRVEICVPQSYTETQALVHPSRVLYKNCATGYDTWLLAEGYLTLVLGCVSIVALFSVLLTYFLFAKLRNLPGVNTMSLTFALFLAEVIFATGEEVQIPWLCTTVAVSLHYCFLASHCWMFVMSYDVCRTFAGDTCILTRVRDKNKFFPRYALFAWGAPLLVIGACLFIDLSHAFPGVSIGYGGSWAEGRNDTGFYPGGNWSAGYEKRPTGSDPAALAPTASALLLSGGAGSDVIGGAGSDVIGDDHPGPPPLTGANETDDDDGKIQTLAGVDGHSFSCWIQKPLAAMFAFGAPIMVIFLVNLAFFTRTIVSIERTTRLARHSGAGRTNSSNSARRVSGRSDVILYVKMASVMGFTWVFGLASSVISAATTEPTTSVCYGMHVLGVLFPILNSSQGLFIFFAFVFNRRVLQLYRRLARKAVRFLMRQKDKLAAARGQKKPMADIATISKN